MEIEELKAILFKFKPMVAIGLLLMGYYFFTQTPSDTLESSQQMNSFIQVETEKGETIEENLVEERSLQHIYVDIKGAVRCPGMYQLEHGTRVYDVIQAAEGLTDDAASDTINLARLLEDQMMIYIPTLGEVEANVTHSNNLTDQPNFLLPQTESAGSSDLVNINSADQAQLETLPGIGPAKAQAIIQYRQDFGSFKNVQDLLEVSGIGEKTFKQLEDMVTVK